MFLTIAHHEALANPTASLTNMSSSSQCAGSTPSLSAVTLLHNHGLARSRFPSSNAAFAGRDGSSPTLSATSPTGSLDPANIASQQPQLRSPSEQAEKLQKFLSILHEAIDLINEDDDDDDDDGSDWM
jgi:hypothetical protein